MLGFEVLSPDDRWPAVAAKAREFVRAGSKAVWAIDPAGPAGPVARVYTRQGMRMVGSNGILRGSRVLPGFRLPLADLMKG